MTECKGGRCKNPVGRNKFKAATVRAKQIRKAEPSVPWQMAISRAYCELHGDTKRVCALKHSAGKGKGKAAGGGKPTAMKAVPAKMSGGACPKGHKVCKCNKNKGVKHNKQQQYA